MLALATHGALQVGPPQLPAQEEDPPPRWLIRNVVRWLPLIDRWSPEFPELEPALILAVIAQESQGFPYAEADDGWGSVGLMQVIPRSWTGTREQLMQPEFNTYVGMRMLSAVLSKTGGDLRIALASYNCGGKGDGKRLSFKHCRPGGGLDYADRILGYWLPVFRRALGVVDPARAALPDWIGRRGRYLIH